METCFKSEDGVLELIVRHKPDKSEILSIKIKEKSTQSIKIKPKQTQFIPIDKDTLAIRFSLD